MKKFLGDKSPSWKGGINRVGNYIIIYSPWHPNCDEHGYVRQHRLIMEGFLGRFLEPYEVVHHINGNTKDNKIENLKLMTYREHKSFHFSGENNPSWRGGISSDKEYIKRMRRKYYLRNLIKERNYAIDYNKIHKNERNLYNKQYNESHKEQIKEYNKKYKSSHKEQIKNQKKEYNYNHKTQLKEYNRKQYLKRKEKRYYAA